MGHLTIEGSLRGHRWQNGVGRLAMRLRARPGNGKLMSGMGMSCFHQDRVWGLSMSNFRFVGYQLLDDYGGIARYRTIWYIDISLDLLNHKLLSRSSVKCAIYSAIGGNYWVIQKSYDLLVHPIKLSLQLLTMRIATEIKKRSRLSQLR